MLISYYKGEPNTFLIAYRNGKRVEHGIGKSILYSPVTTTIAQVPVTSQNVPFIFTESSANYQEVSIQGQLTYRLADPVKAAAYLDFTVISGRYRSEDPETLTQRIINTVQGYTRNGVSSRSLEEALTEVKSLASSVLMEVNADDDLQMLGVEVESLHFTSVRATPEMQKALEANYREGLQKRADQAIYDRRAAALEEERKIKEREIGTDIEMENRRQELVEMQAQNSLTLAEAEARAEELKLNPYVEMAPQALVGLALKEWAAHAGEIGTLNLSTDMLSQLVGWIGSNKRMPEA